MAVHIRMQRRGSKKKAFYAVVAADSRKPRDGRFLEKLGTYDPRLESGGLKVNMDRINHWIGVGAQPSEPVAKLLKASASTGDSPPA
ncbi:MAG: 30S ribosomal protein S16 [Magnetococcales bacterium]|nr:30S ribosomal protein S16 [Magnetococcales bacterium]